MSIGDLEYLGIDELDEVVDVGYSWRGPIDLKLGAPRFSMMLITILEVASQ